MSDPTRRDAIAEAKAVLAPLAIPTLAVFSVQIPVKTLLGQLLKVLV